MDFLLKDEIWKEYNRNEKNKIEKNVYKVIKRNNKSGNENGTKATLGDYQHAVI